MKRYNAEIKGVTPLLQNNPIDEDFDPQWKEKKAWQDFAEEALKKLYFDGTTIYQPSIHLERALIDGGKKLKMKGAGKATYSKIFASMVTIEPFAIPMNPQKFDIHKCLVVIPSTKGRVMRYRPIFKDWSLSFEIEFEDEISPQTIKEGLEIAGKYSGIGDWRPEKKGKFGKFQVVHFKESK